MRNPLYKRIPRELKTDFTKYLAIFLLLIGMIGLVSGFLVADESMIKAYDDSFETYNVEDGHFITKKALNKAQRRAISKDTNVYDLYYYTDTIGEGKIRLFQKRTEVNLECLMDGNFPTKQGEIALDRMYCDNNDLHIGDTYTSDHHSWTITGTVALSDYSCLFENNDDSMFDSLTFGIGIVSPEEFETYKNITYCYAWTYKNPVKDEKTASDDYMDVLLEEVHLEEYIPRYINQAIIFTGEDMGSDKAMIQLLLYILIAIIAFVFAVTISNTIIQESMVIGTLRASGYTRKELIAHYMILPLIITIAGCLIGNILGYTYFKGMMADLYYNSYSLTTYKTIWSAQAFIETTLFPFVLMVIINYGVLKYKLSLSPLKFIRRDLKRRKQKRALKLPHSLPFFSKFRLRIILQNLGNYSVMFVGILFANLLLLFGLGLPDMLDNFKVELTDNMFAQYQYVLSYPIQSDEHKLESMINMLVYSNQVETDNEDAEKFSAYNLKTLGDEARQETIMLYGVDEDSHYISIKHDDGVYISSSYAEKYGYKKGDTFTLKEPYENKQYTFKVSGVYPYSGSISVFMDRKDLNKLLDLGNDFFCGYFSNTPITDINEDYIGSIIDMNALTKISRQLDHSMGDMAYLVDVLAMVMFMILMYLLSKTIIEKNAQNISLTKILGYDNKEVALLYLLATSIVVVIMLGITIPLNYALLKPIFMAMMKEEMTGWISFNISLSVFIKTFIIGVLTYCIVAYLEYRRIRAIPMDEALKNVE